MDMLKTQLIAKGVVNEKEWREISQKMRIDFMQDNHFTELKQAELIQDRMNILRDVQEQVGRYYSEEWVRKNILQQTEEEIERMDKQIKDEIAAGKYKDPSKEDDMF
jgi:archaellum component FlaC